MSGLGEQERHILLDPCECGHTLNDHGDLGGCWVCNETNDRECWVRCEDMFAERAGRIAAARTEQARPEHVVRAEALREASAVLNDWPESATIGGSYRAADYRGEFAEWLRDRADALEVQP